MPDLSTYSDAMSNVLGLLRMQGETFCAAETFAPWSLGFNKSASYLHIIDSGVLWLILDGQDPIRLIGGDLIILPVGGGHVLSSDPALPAIPIKSALETARRPGPGVCRFGGDGEPASLVCGQFRFDGMLAPRLMSVLPRLIHIRPKAGHSLEWIKLTRHFLIDEVYNPRPGSAIMITRLLELLFIQAIREWGARGEGNLGWLSGLSDPQIGRALSVIHDDPGSDWTVEQLAQFAGLSRSVFAVRFAQVVGQTPLRYLTIWRLNLAAEHLRSGTMKISDIALAVGYNSEAALSRAFKAQFGVSPGLFRRAGEAPASL